MLPMLMNSQSKKDGGMIGVGKITRWVFYPWLLALYPVIYLYSVNLGEIRAGDVVEVVLATGVGTSLLFGLLYAFIRNSHKTGAITSLIALIFLTYGHLYSLLAGNRFGQVTLLPAILALAVLLCVLILRSKAVWPQLTPYLNGIFAILVLMPLWTVIDFHRNEAPASSTALVNPYERVVSVPTVNNSPERPDVYYIILDGYSSNSLWMDGYGYDNSDFTGTLEERGFYVAQDSESSYGATLLSLPSSLLDFVHQAA